jgi:hypothetical protein
VRDVFLLLDDISETRSPLSTPNARQAGLGEVGTTSILFQVLIRSVSFMANGFATGSIVYIDGGALVI